MKSWVGAGVFDAFTSNPLIPNNNWRRNSPPRCPMAKKPPNPPWPVPLDDRRAVELARTLGIPSFDDPVDRDDWILLWAAIGRHLAEKEFARLDRGRPKVWDIQKLGGLILDLLAVNKNWTKPPSAPRLAKLLCAKMPEKYGMYSGSKLPTFSRHVLFWRNFISSQISGK